MKKALPSSIIDSTETRALIAETAATYERATRLQLIWLIATMISPAAIMTAILH